MSQELLSLCKLAKPNFIAGLLQFLKTIISVLFLSKMGLVELAGGSFSISFANLSGHSIMRGLAMAMEPICSQAYGAKRWAVLTQTHNRTVLLLLLATVPITVLWLAMGPILLWSGQDEEFIKVVKEYMTYDIIELLAQAYLCVLNNFIRSQGITEPISESAIYAIALHWPINYSLVNYLKLGVKGVAIASGNFHLIMIIHLVIYLSRSGSTLKPWDDPEPTSSACSQGWKPLLISALHSTGSVCLEWWWYEIMLLICSKLKNAQENIAAMGIAMQLTGLLYVFPSSLSLSMSTRVGNELGANQPLLAQKLTKLGVASASVMGLVAFVITYAVKDYLGLLYTQENGILLLLSKALPLIGFCELGNFPQTTAVGILRGSARQKEVVYTYIFSFYFVGFPIALAATLIWKMGFKGVWIGHAVAEFLCVGIFLAILFRTDWNDQAKRAKELVESDLDDTEEHLLGG